MGRRLALGLFCEGPSDAEALAPLLRRMVARLLGGADVDLLEEVVPLVDTRKASAAFEQRVTQAIAGDRLSLDLVFVHQDADGRDGAAAAARVAALGPFERGPALVPVVPVRCMEAWLLADPRAWVTALGLRAGTRLPGVPSNAREVERIAAPKAVIEDLVRSLRGGRRARAVVWFARVGEECALDRLEAVPAFARMQEATRDALIGKAYLRR